MDEPGTTEAALVEQAVAGNKEAFGRLYLLLRDSIYRYIRQRVGNDSDAEDLTSQVFLKAWEALPRYKQGASPFASWLFRIAHNLTLNHLRAGGRTIVPFNPDLVPPDLDQPPAVDQVIADEERAYLVSAISQLPEVQRQVIQMRFFEERSYLEISQLIEKSLAACRVIQHRAVSNLHRFLAGPLLAIVFVLLSAGGIVLASEETLPGDVYYPVKRVVEQTRLAMTLDVERSAELRLVFAERRLQEAEALLAQKRTVEVASALAAYAEQVDAVVVALSAQPAAADADPLALARQVTAMETAQLQRLRVLGDLAPPEAQPALQAAVARWQLATQLAHQRLNELSEPVSSAMQQSATPPTATPMASVTVAANTAPGGLPGAPTALNSVPSTAPPTFTAIPGVVTPSPTAPALSTAPAQASGQQSATLMPGATLAAPPMSSATPSIAPQPIATTAPTATETAPPMSSATPSSTPQPIATTAPTATETAPPPVPSDTATPMPTATFTPLPTASATPAVSPTVLDDSPLFLQAGMFAARQRSQGRQLRGGDAATITIALANGTENEVRAKIVELLPPELEYLDGSASITASYDTLARTLTWEAITVPARSFTLITVTVRAQPVTGPTPITLALQVTPDEGSVAPVSDSLTLVVLP